MTDTKQSLAALAKELVASATGMDIPDVPDDASIDHWAPWDSLAHIRIILALETYLGRDLPIDQVLAMSKLADIEAALAHFDD